MTHIVHKIEEGERGRGRPAERESEKREEVERASKMSKMKEQNKSDVLLFRGLQRSIDVIGLGLTVALLDVFAFTAAIHAVHGRV